MKNPVESHPADASKRPPRTLPGSPALPVGPASAESSFDSRLLDLDLDLGVDDGLSSNRWMGWQLRVVVAAALLGCVAFFVLARWLANMPHVDARWNVAADGQVQLAASADPLLHQYVGTTLRSVRATDGKSTEIDGVSLHPSLRWVVDPAQRAKARLAQERLSATLDAGSPTLVFDRGEAASVTLHKRGSASLGGMFWLLGAFALVLYLVAMVVLCSHPDLGNLLYAVMAVCQVGNLVTIAIESTLELGLPGPMPMLDMPLRMTFDLLTAAAIVTSICLHPRRLPGAPAIAALCWAAALLAGALTWRSDLQATWFWAQAVVLTLGVAAVALLSWSHRMEPHPFAVVLRRLGLVVVGSFGLLSLGVVATDGSLQLQRMVATVGATTWCVLFAALVLMVPFLAKTQLIMREFSLLAAISTIATSLDLLFVAVFSLGQFASLTLSLFLSLGVYAGARQWVLNRLLGSSKLTTERMFEQLYRIAREVEVRPDLAPALLSNLMRDLFEPLELMLVPRQTRAARVFRSGSALILPVPSLDRQTAESVDSPMSIVLRYAHRGRQLFTADDAKLSDRIAEQFRRAVAFDQAVEQGRSEERTRLAQDLHDDIGARLLTLMYKAASPEIEEYVRHTLKDLKTLTRGLAASHHPLSHAAAEWKADLTQRLTVAEMELVWDARFANDQMLTVVQWSALTRVLRELVSNTIAHSNARRVEIRLRLAIDGTFNLTVGDDGEGRNPAIWSHGLGLGGVRKRVKQLGGEVEWKEAEPRGILCLVTIGTLKGVS